MMSIAHSTIWLVISADQTFGYTTIIQDFMVTSNPIMPNLFPHQIPLASDKSGNLKGDLDRKLIQTFSSRCAPRYLTTYQKIATRGIPMQPVMWPACELPLRNLALFLSRDQQIRWFPFSPMLWHMWSTCIQLFMKKSFANSYSQLSGTLMSFHRCCPKLNPSIPLTISSSFDTSSLPWFYF
jgi:hypothetical protein